MHYNLLKHLLRIQFFENTPLTTSKIILRSDWAFLGIFGHSRDLRLQIKSEKCIQNKTKHTYTHTHTNIRRTDDVECRWSCAVTVAEPRAAGSRGRQKVHWNDLVTPTTQYSF